MTYDLEYGKDTLEMHADAIVSGSGCWSWTTCWRPAGR